MSEFKQTFNSSLGKKLIMALTGLFLCTFLIVHLGGNLLLFRDDKGYGFNMYANFLTHFPPIEVIAYILYLCILVHALYALILTLKNGKARPVKYYAHNDAPATWQSKNMGLLGSILLLFIVIHMSDFWFAYKYSNKVPYIEYRTNLSTGQMTSVPYNAGAGDFEKAIFTTTDPRSGEAYEIVRVKDLHFRVADSFSNPLYDLFYVIAMIAVSYHLLHGFQSAFQTLGWTHRKYTPVVQFVGRWLFAVIIPVGFALMPIVYYLQSLGK
jgi:succinate dehydrogenase / fumarate reductase cytochrome b subunit